LSDKRRLYYSYLPPYDGLLSSQPYEYGDTKQAGFDFCQFQAASVNPDIGGIGV